MYLLAVVYEPRSYDEAEELLTRALLIQERQFRFEDLDTLYARGQSAGVYLSQQRCGDAELKRVLSVQMRTCSSQHADTFTTMHKLAPFYDSQHRYHDAEELFTQVLLGKEKI